jgi:hypothetical protein
VLVMAVTFGLTVGGSLGLLLQPLFVGPPILIQVVAIEHLLDGVAGHYGVKDGATRPFPEL